MNIHRLNGCAPTPLAHYLKALGVFRLVAAQADPEARAWWSGDSFFLAAELDYGELLRFFLERYAPTQLVSPWNKGSGFYYENDAALAASAFIASVSSDGKVASNVVATLGTALTGWASAQVGVVQRQCKPKSRPTGPAQAQGARWHATRKAGGRAGLFSTFSSCEGATGRGVDCPPTTESRSGTRRPREDRRRSSCQTPSRA